MAVYGFIDGKVPNEKPEPINGHPLATDVLNSTKGDKWVPW